MTVTNENNKHQQIRLDKITVHIDGARTCTPTMIWTLMDHQIRLLPISINKTKQDYYKIQVQATQLLLVVGTENKIIIST